MFHSARIKLTAWYLLIIMTVSMAFSAIIYRTVVHEVERYDRSRARLEYRIRQEGIVALPPLTNPVLVQEVEQRVFFTLLLVNAGILVLSGGLGYFLAGRTLSPIREMMEEQNRFIADASHELKTPITSLKSAFEVFLRNKNRTAADADKLVKESITETNKLQLLAESLLNLSHEDVRSEPLIIEQVHVNEIIEPAIRRMNPRAREKEIQISSKTHAVVVDADRTQFTDLLVILLDNAIKYSPRGSSITISAKKSGNHAVISVTDQGIGIPQKDIPHIFDRFYRADTARSKDGTGGYGLGLSIAQKIINLHGGSITVLSKLKNGSTFTITLPIHHERR